MSKKNLISHIGIAVEDIEKAILQYSALTDCDNPEIEEVSDQKVKVAIFDRHDSESGRIELVAPTSDDSPIRKFLEKNGEGLHHVCIYVDDIEKKLHELKNSGFTLIDESPRIGAGGKKIAFIHPKSCNSVLIELEEIQ